MTAFTEEQERVQSRWARWTLGGYGWFPKTDDEREQVRLLMAITQKAREEYAARDPHNKENQ